MLYPNGGAPEQRELGAHELAAVTHGLGVHKEPHCRSGGRRQGRLQNRVCALVEMRKDP